MNDCDLKEMYTISRFGREDVVVIIKDSKIYIDGNYVLNLNAKYREIEFTSEEVFLAYIRGLLKGYESGMLETRKEVAKTSKEFMQYIGAIES